MKKKTFRDWFLTRFKVEPNELCLYDIRHLRAAFRAGRKSVKKSVIIVDPRKRASYYNIKARRPLA